PGAREAGVMSYVETALGQWHAHHLDAYAAGLEALEQRALDTYGQGFARCEDAEQDSLLEQIEGDGAFFDLVRTHAIEGMFGDPRWGGNAGGAGWELLGYPGPRREWTAAEQQLGAAVDGSSAPR
ncbi:MAG: gluconate 2-dehydrogenase subunit 3 family protein, partial [Solirubrobacteraceae bacterium]